MDRFFKRIYGWEFRCLSLGGRVILTQIVLAQLGVYWAHLFHIPITIINSLNRIMANFNLGGCNGQKKLHLVKMSHITFPKAMGGWGVMNLRRFGWSLLIKSLWRGIFGPSTWSRVIRHKYLKEQNFLFWYRKGTIGSLNGSAIWLSFHKVAKIFLQHLAWSMGSGHGILIGVDHFMGDGIECNIFVGLLHCLNGPGI